MANSTILPDGSSPDFMKLRKLGSQVMITNIFSTQQHRSQALHDNHKEELAPANQVDDRKAAMYHMMEQLNILAENSTQFLEFVGLKVTEIERRQDEAEIWELCKVDKDKLLKSARRSSISSIAEDHRNN